MTAKYIRPSLRSNWTRGIWVLPRDNCQVLTTVRLLKCSQWLVKMSMTPSYWHKRHKVKDQRYDPRCRHPRERHEHCKAGILHWRDCGYSDNGNSNTRKHKNGENACNEFVSIPNLGAISMISLSMRTAWRDIQHTHALSWSTEKKASRRWLRLDSIYAWLCSDIKWVPCRTA